MLSSETLPLYQTRHEEGYDLKTDTVYNVWKKLKDAQLCKLNPGSNEVPPMASKSEDSQTLVPGFCIQVTPGQATVSVESVLDTILVYPRNAAGGRKGKSSEMPRHLSTHQSTIHHPLSLKPERERSKRRRLNRLN